LHGGDLERPERRAIEDEIDAKADEVAQHEAEREGEQYRRRRDVDVHEEQREDQRRHDQRRVKEHLARAVRKEIERHTDRFHEVRRDAAVVQLVVEQAGLVDIHHQAHQQRDGRVREDRVERQLARRGVVRVECDPHHAQQIEPDEQRRHAREDLEAVRRLTRHRDLRELEIRDEAKARARRDSVHDDVLTSAPWPYPSK
jgi:hypothetical protein